MSATRLERSLAELVEPLLEPEGYELVELEYRGGKSSVLRLYVDRSEGRDPITIEDCVRVSRLVEPALDAADLIATAYSLEVSSPGVERPLRKARDFVRFVGESARVTAIEDNGAKHTRVGRIFEPDDEGFGLDSGGEILRYRIEQVESANLEFVFGGGQPKKKS